MLNETIGEARVRHRARLVEMAVYGSFITRAFARSQIRELDKSEVRMRAAQAEFLSSIIDKSG